MTAIFFYVSQHRDSQTAYKLLMSTKIPFKTFEIKGKNVSEKLKQYGIDKVPTLYFPNKKSKVEGSQNIARFLQVDSRMLNRPQHSRQSTEIRRPKQKKSKKPNLEAKYQKALKDDYYEESDFDRKYKEYKEAMQDPLFEEDDFLLAKVATDKQEGQEGQEEESSFYGSDDDELDSDVDNIIYSDVEEDSDEISLEV